MIKYIKEITTPADAVRPVFRPEFKEVFDARDAILEKYKVPGMETTIVKNKLPDGSEVTVLTRFFESVEKFDQCFAELLISNRLPVDLGDQSTTVASHNRYSGIQRRQQLLDAETDKVIRDWEIIN